MKAPDIKLKEGPTLPHEREYLAILDMVVKAYEIEGYLGVFVCDTYSQVQHLLGTIRSAVAWDRGNARIYREGIEVDNGGKIIGTSLQSPDRLRGLVATEVVIFGNIGEFFYCAEASLSHNNGRVRFIA